MDIALLFPGQGAQQPGMGKDLADAFPAARAVFDEADRALGFSLSTLCFDGPAESLKSTENAQPALLAHGAAIWAVTRGRLAPYVRAAAGHSLGEFSAYHAAGALTLGDAVVLVRRRGELMHEAGVSRPGAMAALLGELGEPIDSLCARASAEVGEVVPANYNSVDQVVVSGEVSGVERVMELAKAAGVKRAVRLNVSGAFHSPLMAPSAPGLEAALSRVSLRDPRFPVYSNVTEQPTTRADSATGLLLRQLTSPVRWMGLIRNMASAYPGVLFVEMGPGNVLSGLVKRIVPGARTATCASVRDIEQLLAQAAA
jgi:[acyl-carrier-protein] S-malonyltransferase